MEPEYREPNNGKPCIFDTHAHVSTDAFDKDRCQVLKRARLSRVSFMEVGFDEDSSRKSLMLAENTKGYCAAGIHPHEVAREQCLENRWKHIEELASHFRVKAIGEVGLDYFRNLSPQGVQRDAFAMGLDLARRLGLPVIIHQRDASEDVLSLVKAHNPGTPLVFHCFSQGLDYARRCLDLGGYIGLGGPLTYPRNGYLRDMLSFLPPDRLLVETDCPYLAPQAKRGKRNEPAFIVEVVASIAAILGRPPGEIAKITFDNGRRAFGITG
ncbi:MAG: TatD family hydrolase [Bacillota bacterium]|jgi:TatD DNase family protein